MKLTHQFHELPALTPLHGIIIAGIVIATMVLLSICCPFVRMLFISVGISATFTGLAVCMVLVIVKWSK